MSLATVVLPGVILGSLILYALFGGADFGGGIWDLLATGSNAREQREAIADALAPIWETNHVWLILVIVLLFTAYPPAFGAIMTALHIPITVVLIGIVLRGSTFVFRKYDRQHDRVFRRWSTIFGISSALTPLFLGITLGALATGEIRIRDGQVTSGFLAGWTSLFSVACGLFAQALFAFLAAVYMTVETFKKPRLQEAFRVRALVSGFLLAPLALGVYLLAAIEAPVLFDAFAEWWSPYLVTATSVCAIGALLALWFRRYYWARIAAGGQVGLILLGWGLAQYPYLIIPDVTFAGTAAPPNILTILVWALVGGGVILLPALVYLFRVFKTTPL